MPFTIERVDDKPAYIATLIDFDAKNEVAEYYAELVDILNEETQVVSIILSIPNASIQLDSLMTGTKSALDAVENPYDHPNTKELIIVTDNSLLKFSINGFRKLGIAKNIRAAESIEAALLLV